jgi:hypothetical protein
VTALLALLLVLAQSLLLTQRQPTVQLHADSQAVPFVTSGLYAVETDARGSYRWTNGASEIDLPLVVPAEQLLLSLHLGPTFAGHDVPYISLRMADQRALLVALDDQPRHYQFIVPPGATDHHLHIELNSETVTVPPDTREVGLRVEQLALRATGTGWVWLAPAHALAQTLILVLGALLVWRVRLRLLPASGVLLLLGALLLLLALLQPLLLHPYAARWVVALAVLALLTYALLPAAERHLTWIAPPPLLRAMWGIALLACAIRLVGSLYPLFSAFDLDLNVERFLKTMAGDLVVISRSIEFRNAFTVYPPGAYIVMLPAALLGLDPHLLVQGSLAIIDGFGALAIAALARVLGGSPRTAIFAALLYAALPIHLTALWFGLTAQIFAQAMMPPLALALVLAVQRDSRAAWLAVGIFLSLALLTHIGVTVNVLAWLGLVWLVVGWQQRVWAGGAGWAIWRRFAAVVVIATAISVIGIYASVVAIKLHELLYVADKVQSSGYVPASSLIITAFRISFHELGILLLPLGLLLLLRSPRLPPVGVALVLGWLASVLLFVTIEVLTGLQVRYIYFITPLACIALGWLLDRLAARGSSGRAVAWLVVALLLSLGFFSWQRGAFDDIMMSMSPLLR